MINKRECRKHVDPGLSFDIGSGLFHAEQVKYLVRSMVKNISGRRMLILYFFNCKRILEGCSAPEYTLFQYRDDYITMQLDSKGIYIWRTASLDNLQEHNLVKQSAFYRHSDEQRVSEYCRLPDCTGFDALDSLQSKIMSKRLSERIRKREQKTVRRMEHIPAIPRGLKGWVHRDVLPHYIFYDYVRGNKPMNGYCTACRHEITCNNVRYNDTGKCPRCGKAVTFKSSGKAKRVWDRTTVQVLQRVSGDELLLRIFKVYNSLNNWRNPRFSIMENARFFIRQTDTDKVEVEPFYYFYGSALLTNWKPGRRPRLMHYQYHFEGDLCGHLYSDYLDDALTGTKWQYCQLGRFYQTDHEPLEVLPYLRAYLKYPSIEYLVKLGLSNLAGTLVYECESKILNGKGKKLQEVLGVGMEDLPLLQKTNANIDQLELCQSLRKLEIRPDENFIKWFKERGISTKDDVLIPLEYTTQSRLMRYVEEQFEQLKDVKIKYGGVRYAKPGKVLSEYKDYLEMGSKLKYNFLDDFVMFPKNMMEAHDQVSKLYSSKKNAIFSKTIREAYAGLSALYRFANDEFTLIPPKSVNEIVKEGHTLHHCVHSYVEKVVNGKCVILFIRKKDNVKEPFYTMEIQGNRIIQVHGKHHCAPTPEIQKFIDLWESKVLLQTTSA